MINLTCNSQGYFQGKFMMPNQCPYCHKNNIVQPEKVLELPISTDDTAVLVSAVCNECDKHYIVIYQRSKDRSRMDFLQLVPILQDDTCYENLFVLSPAFEEIHKQAMQAYQTGLSRLAVIGFRTAIEVLMKDFVISEIGDDAQKVAEMRLNNIIQQYFKSLEDHDYARAVQALGNDCTHYVNKHKDYNAKDVAEYYQMIVGIINSRCKCRQIDKGIF